MRDEPKPPSELLSTVPRELDRLIQRCLRKEPSRRIQSMADVRLELEQIEEDSRSSRPALVPIRLPRARRGWLAAAVAGAVALSALALWQWRDRRPSPSSAPPRLVTLVSLGGLPSAPSFSPDGEQVAFTWTGERSLKVMSPSRVNALPWNIYITMPGSAEVRQVTTGTAGDFAPNWSPDGRQIAFTRGSGNGSTTLHLVSPLGGTVRQLSDLPVAAQASWSPDGRWLATARPGPRTDAAPEAGEIALFPADGSAPRSLVPASPGGWNTAPDISRDGRQLAFVACFESVSAVPACEIQVLRLGPDFVPIGSPRTVTPERQQINALVWGLDDAEILYVPGWGTGHAMRGQDRRTVSGREARARRPRCPDAGHRPVTHSAGLRTLALQRRHLPVRGGPGTRTARGRLVVPRDRQGLLARRPQDRIRIQPHGPLRGVGQQRRRHEPDAIGGRQLAGLTPLVAGRCRVLGVADGLAFSIAVSPDSRTILFTRIVGFGNDLMMIDHFR